MLANPPARHYETTKDHAEQLGAIAFFGDKYGDIVRVLEAGPHSTELCGGTHVRALGDIGPVKIVVRGLHRLEHAPHRGGHRLRAASSACAPTRPRSRQAADALGVATDELVDAVERRMAEIKELRDELKALRAPGWQPGGPTSSPPPPSTASSWPASTGSTATTCASSALAVRDRPGVRAVGARRRARRRAAWRWSRP